MTGSDPSDLDGSNPDPVNGSNPDDGDGSGHGPGNGPNPDDVDGSGPGNADGPHAGRPSGGGDPTVGGVLLAAGRSSRFEGGNKLLAEVAGIPVVRRAAESLLATDLQGPIVVLGYEAESVEQALEGLDVAVRVNENYAAGQSTSVAVGVAAARERGWDAAVFALGDMPAVDPRTVEALLAAYREGEGTVLAPAYEGSRGNPVLFDREHFDDLAAVTGDRGGRDLVEAEGRLVAVDDPGVLRDVDRLEDL